MAKEPHEYRLERMAFVRWLLSTPHRIVSIRDIVHRFRIEPRAARRWMREEQISHGWEMLTPVYHKGCIAGSGPDGEGLAGCMNGAISYATARHRALVCEHCDELVDMDEARVDAGVLLLPPLSERRGKRDGAEGGE